jgi:hypothetical protein
MKMRRIVMGAVLSLAFAAAPVAAQELPENRLSLEPYAGALIDSYDISPDGENTGVLLGLRLGYDLGGRARLLADAAYAGSGNVSDPSGLESYFVYDNTWVLTTLGAEYDVVPGRTSLALGLRAGAGWRRVDHAGQVGDPGDQQRQDVGGFSPVDLVVPSLTVRHEITARSALRLTLADNVFDVLEGPADHSPSISLGLSLR